MIKASVKKPFTVIVAVIVVMLLGVVALLRTETSLLPDMDLPYMVVITTYPGATPEKVEESVTKPLESTLGTVSGVESVQSTSAENYSAITLEFADGTDMDSAMVKVSSAVNQTVPFLPEEAGTPNIMEISMDMAATVYLSVSYDGMDIYELSDFTADKIASQFERLDGVASVSRIGLVEKTLEVRLDQDKIDVQNKKILTEANEKLKEAEEELLDAEQKLQDSEKEMEDQEAKLKSEESKLEKTQEDTTNQLSDAALALDQAEAQKSAFESALTSLQAKKTALSAERQAYIDNHLPETKNQLDQLFFGVKSLVQSLEAASIASNLAQQQQTAQTPQVPVTTFPGVQVPQPQVSATPEVPSFNASKLGLDSASLPGSVAEAAADPNSIENFRRQVKILKKKEVQQEITQLSMLDPSMKDLPGQTKELTAAADAAGGQLTYEQVKQLHEIVNVRMPQIETELANLEVELQTQQAVVDEVHKQTKELDDQYKQAEAGKLSASIGFGSGIAQIASGKMMIESGRSQLDSAKEQLEEARKQFEDSKETIIKTANLDQLLTLDTLSNLIYAQNFAMPAGYIDDGEDEQWLLKVGENYTSIEDLENMVLTKIDGVGEICLKDVALLTVIDNAGDSYARVNENRGVMLSVFKGSTAGTSAVSDAVKKEIEVLEKEYNGLHIVPLIDQGDYIDMVVKSILQSMVLGAILAVLILAVFLMDIRPTLVVAFAIPFSVLTTIVVMYFTGISINLMSLFGISLAIGMLVDNSIVVIENIYRLRYKGLMPARAAVQGTKQVAGAIIASTLTTICVFLPIVFTTGLVRQLMLPFSLTITYALTASLVVAMTVVPVMGMALLKRTKEQKHRIFDRIQELYGKVLEFCLRFKIVPLGIAVGLLVFCIYAVIQMGVVLLPDAGSSQITIEAELSEDLDQEACYAMADEIIDKVTATEGVAYIGAMDGTAAGGIAGSFLGGTGDYHNLTGYIIPEEGLHTSKDLNALIRRLRDAMEEVDAEVTVSNSMMGDMSLLLGSGLSVEIRGEDLEELVQVSEEICDVVSGIEGFEAPTNGMEEPEQELHLIIDKNKAMGLGITTAQIYQLINARLTTDKSAISVRIDDTDMDVLIVDETDLLTRGNLLAIPFDETIRNDDGTTETKEHFLREIASFSYGETVPEIQRKEGNRMITVEAAVKEGYSLNLLERTFREKMKDFKTPKDVTWDVGGESQNIIDMLKQMALLMALGAVLIYLVMVAQFQSLLSPFIVIFTVPLAFTGGLLGMLAAHARMSLVSLMGFLVLMGTVVNNGIVFVDYTNQLRLGGLDKKSALIATGKTRMRPILMTAMTTILAMLALVFSQDVGNEMSKDMAIVVAAGLAYATLMTLFIVPVLYDIFYRKQPRTIDVGEDNLDDVPDDAQDYLDEMSRNYEDRDS